MPFIREAAAQKIVTILHEKVQSSGYLLQKDTHWTALFRAR